MACRWQAVGHLGRIIGRCPTASRIAQAVPAELPRPSPEQAALREQYGLLAATSHETEASEQTPAHRPTTGSRFRMR